MIIGIDGYEANVEHRVGIGQYAYQILRALVALKSEHIFVIFLPSPPRSDMPQVSANVKYVVGRPGSFWTIRQLPTLIKNNPVNVFFSPTHYTPYFVKVPRVCAVMDVSYLYFPQLFRKKDYWQLRLMGGHSIRMAEKILTISEFSKQEIMKHYNRASSDITITYPGIDPIFRQKTKQTDIFKKYGLQNKYILYVGTLQPRKNIERLIEAFELLKGDTQLVLAGKTGWLYESILTRISSSVKKNLIKHISFVPNEDLPALYAHAACFVLVSLYEGFGIPVVEALSCKCPVVVSRISSLPEIANNFGIYVDPYETSSIAKGLEEALQLSVEKRNIFGKAAEKYSQKFNWSTAAEKALEVLVHI